MSEQVAVLVCNMGSNQGLMKVVVVGSSVGDCHVLLMPW